MTHPAIVDGSSRKDDEFEGHQGYMERMAFAGTWSSSGIRATFGTLVAVFAGVVTARWTVLLSWPDTSDFASRVLAAASVVLAFCFGSGVTAGALIPTSSTGRDYLAFCSVVILMFAISFVYGRG
jgi:hypothetical protein